MSLLVLHEYTIMQDSKIDRCLLINNIARMQTSKLNGNIIVNTIRFYLTLLVYVHLK